MIRSHSKRVGCLAGTLFLVFFLFPLNNPVRAESENYTPMYSPVVNGEALRGLSTIGSAEPMGAGRITFGFLAPWYRQQTGYLNAPNNGADVFTGSGAFSYGVNSYVDLFASLSGYGISNYTINNKTNSGLGTISAGAQGSLPFPNNAFIRMGGQTAIIGGTSQNQINTFRADGYNYFETRTGYDFIGKLLQTFLSGNEDYGLKLHLNEAGVIGISHKDPALMLLGAGLQGNIGFVVLGAEINSRTRFNDMAFSTDPLWFTPSVHFRTPYQMNAMAGVDISLSADRPNNDPQALAPYRIFGALEFSFDMLAGRRNAELSRRHKEAQDKADLEHKAAMSEKNLSMKSLDDSVTLANEKRNGRNQMDSMRLKASNDAQTSQAIADLQTKKAYADSIALVRAAGDLAYEKEKRSDAEKQLLSTGELLLDAVYFKTGKTIISINSKPYLNIIGKMLVKYPKLQIEVAGHTDNVGSVDYNVNLSQGRSEAVRNYLTQVSPALGATLTAHGYGMSMPKADNGTAEGRTANRRVELRVTNKDALQQYSQN